MKQFFARSLLAICEAVFLRTKYRNWKSHIIDRLLVYTERKDGQ